MMMSLENEILTSIVPSKSDKEHIEKCSHELLNELKEDAQIREYGIQVMLVGSVAKGTYLRNPDIDLFLLFPEDFNKKDLQKIGLEIGKNHLEQYEERYAEHPYMHGIRYGYELDVVPCYMIKTAADLKCAVDRTPFHTKYIQKMMDEPMKDEVRLLKQFTKGIGVYGAESKVEGMSGYLIELLIIKYGSFLGVLKAAASKWKYGYVTFPNNERKFPEDAFVVHDPIDKNRNVASALSLQSFSTFIQAAKEYLEKPSLRFFFPVQRVSLMPEEAREIMLKRGTYLVLIELDRPDLIDDNLYPQVRKTLEGILSIMQRVDITPLSYSYCVTNNSIQYMLEVDNLLLPSLSVHDGPPVWSDHSKSFLEKWKDGEYKPFVNEGHWQVMIHRSDRCIANYIKKSLKDASLGKDFRKLAGLKTTTNPEIIFDEKYMAVVSAMIDKRMNWEIV